MRGEVWRHTTTRKGSLFIKQYQGRPPGCTTFACAYSARSPTGRRQAHKQGCIVQCAQPREARACTFRMPVAQMQAAPRSIAKKLATEIAGAKALERARRSGCCREERKAVCRRHGEPAQARPRPHRLEGGAARRAREERGVALNIAVWPRIDRMALFYDRRGCAVMKRLLLGKARHI